LDLKIYVSEQELITNIAKLSFVIVLWFRLEIIFDTASAASKTDHRFKSGQKYGFKITILLL